MTTTRAIRDDVQAVLDYLSDADLALYPNGVSMQAGRISWHSQHPAIEFLTTREHGTVEQYRTWVINGSYSAILFDASLLQITYNVANGKVTGHRLAYIPCPFSVDRKLLEEFPVADVIDSYSNISDVTLRSPVRFDYDPAAAGENHPAAHLTINSTDCRIACVAPMHVLRFVDFVFRYFYPRLWKAHHPFFKAASERHIGDQVLDFDHRRAPHLMWDVHATATS